MNNDRYFLERELLAKKEDALSKKEIFWRKNYRAFDSTVMERF